MLKEIPEYYYADVLEKLVKEYEGIAEISYDIDGITYSAKELIEHLRIKDAIGYKFSNDIDNELRKFFMKFKE